MTPQSEKAIAPIGWRAEERNAAEAEPSRAQKPGGGTPFAEVNLLVLEDDPLARGELERLYARSGYTVVAPLSAEEGLKRLDGEDIDFVIVNLKLSGIDGVRFIAQVRQNHPEVPVIAISCRGDIQETVDALKVGACDFVMKPLAPTALLESTRAALDNSQRAREMRRVGRWLRRHFEFSETAGQQLQIRHLCETVCLAARTDEPVLIRGETGTSKELIASALHHYSARGAGPFVAVNCAEFSEKSLERELFGPENDAIGAEQRHPRGKIELAHGGTLFLDDIQTLPMGVQGRLLALLEARQFWRQGAPQSTAADVRLVVGGDECLERRLFEGALRRDLYDRLSGTTIHLMPLREHRAGIPALVQNFLQDHPIAKSKRIVSVSDKVLTRLTEYPWPGNIRELQTVLERAIMLAPGRVIDEVELAPVAQDPNDEKSPENATSLRDWLREKEKLFLSQRLEELRGNVALTAKSCRIGVRTLSRKMRIYGLDKKIFKDKLVIDRTAARGR
ncbi:MAG TPA: sigma-54 dependent transcriptional regulator [Methylomirabilota bacterium]|nr:sigma-54 dependent transcriptional regulator [Methylomirabilota bacterium]